MGRIVWPERCEEYVGEWADDKPHGRGVHSWYAPAAAASSSSSGGNGSSPSAPSLPAAGSADSLSLALPAAAAAAGAPAPAAAAADADAPPVLSTQSPAARLVGRYSGEWAGGLRHGFGTFWYLNGAR